MLYWLSDLIIGFLFSFSLSLFLTGIICITEISQVLVVCVMTADETRLALVTASKCLPEVTRGMERILGVRNGVVSSGFIIYRRWVIVVWGDGWNSKTSSFLGWSYEILKPTPCPGRSLAIPVLWCLPCYRNLGQKRDPKCQGQVLNRYVS